ncbi:MAG: hypothetical protein KGQ77_08915 [Betaproteobacteria bacterium]|nr:hypothetical protein [Betaproteobacteria bacterium]
MNEVKDLLWRCVQPLLRDFAERIAASDSAVSYSVGHTSSNAFLIRGYASLRKAAVDDEIAVTVDAVFEDGEIALSADACMDDGEVLADGPEATIPSAAMLSSSGTPLAEWLGRFEDFLASIEAEVNKRVAAL